jgi:hypothetical protein
VTLNKLMCNLHKSQAFVGALEDYSYSKVDIDVERWNVSSMFLN